MVRKGGSKHTNCTPFVVQNVGSTYVFKRKFLLLKTPIHLHTQSVIEWRSKKPLRNCSHRRIEMNRVRVLISIAGLVGILALVVYADGPKKIREFLIGFEEVPSVSTTANGEFHARISNDETQVQYELTYRDLEGAVQQAHIHLGQKGVNGGISIFLCTNLGNGPAGTQPCPAPPATITGTITAADISPDIPATAGARAQGLEPGEFQDFLEALRAGVTYVNVHSSKFPAGEMRSQINLNHGEHNGEHDGDGR
jgi:CHRD domain